MLENEVPLGVVELVEDGGPLKVPAPGDGDDCESETKVLARITFTPNPGFMRCRFALVLRPSTRSSSVRPFSSRAISMSSPCRSSAIAPFCDGKDSFLGGRLARLALRCAPVDAGPESNRGSAGIFIRDGGACRTPIADAAPTDDPSNRDLCTGNSPVVGLEFGLIVDKC